MMKMYQAEVLAKFPIMQHMYTPPSFFFRVCRQSSTATVMLKTIAIKVYFVQAYKKKA
jgi:hypothetical protein